MNNKGSVEFALVYAVIVFFGIFSVVKKDSKPLPIVEPPKVVVQKPKPKVIELEEFSCKCEKKETKKQCE